MIEIIREETLKEREERRKRETETGERENIEKEKTETGERENVEKAEAGERENVEKAEAGERKRVEKAEAEEKKDLGIPKNVRQIGGSGGREKIYIEDYVMTHMKQLAACEVEKPQVLILYGKKQIIDGQLFWFVNGAVLAEAIDSFMDQIAFDKDLWAEINHTANNFFKGLSVVGWALLRKNSDSYWDEKIVAAHKKYFHPGQKIFFEYIISERLENMYLFEKGKMNRQSGFFIYYERNEPMQNYMVAYKEKETEPEEEFAGDKATKQFRAIVQEKKERMHKRHTMGLLYGTSIVLVMVIMVIGITMLNNYEKMQNMEQVLYKISGQMEDVQTVEEISAIETDSSDSDVIRTNANSEINGTSTDNVTADIDGQATANSEESPSGEAAANPEESPGGEAAANPEESSDGEATANPEESPGGEAAANPEESPGGEAAANPQEGSGEEVAANSEGTTSQGETANQIANAGGEEVANSEGTASGEEATNQADTTSIPEEYVIQKGDTLAKISRKFYGTESMIKKICELNNIPDMDNILYGEKIILPQL